MKISPFTPLFFNSNHKTDGIESEYVQTFAPSDRIFIELLYPMTGVLQPPIRSDFIINELDGSEYSVIRWLHWDINSSMRVYFAVISLNPGYYSVNINGIGKSDIFRVTDDEEELKNTTLIQYSMKNNRQRNDTVFFIDNMQYFFDFRVPGGFKDSGWSFGVENEQFVTQFADITQLYGLESTQKTFTLGSGAGVPIWYGEMLNRILVCQHVYFDGVKYSRKDTSVPEVSQQLEGLNSFVFTQQLQQSLNLDPLIEDVNHNLIARSIGSEYRITNSNTIRKV